VFGFKIRAHGPTAGAVPPASQYAPRTDIGPALVPVPAMAHGAWRSRGQIHGSPGTMPVPAPDPLPGYTSEGAPLANVGFIGLRSRRNPWWLPSVYFQTDWPGGWLVGVQKINSSHMLPVPAIQPRSLTVQRGTNEPGGISPAAGAWRARYGGGWPIGWPKISANFPS